MNLKINLTILLFCAVFVNCSQAPKKRECFWSCPHGQSVPDCDWLCVDEELKKEVNLLMGETNEQKKGKNQKEE